MVMIKTTGPNPEKVLMGVAGGGAEEQARRAHARVDQLREQLASAEHRAHAWSKGAEGERQVADALAPLTDEGWVVLHDVHWPGRPRANLDHVVVGPGGVVVVDAKKWSGRVTVRDRVLRCESWRKDRELEALAQATAAVAAFLPPQQRLLARGLLCIVEQDVALSTTSAGVAVVGSAHLAEALRELPPRWTPSEVHATATLLRSALDGPVSPPLLTRAAAITASPARPEPASRLRRPVPPRSSRSGATSRPARRSKRRRREPSLREILLRLAAAMAILWFALTLGPGVLAALITGLLPG